MIIFPALDIKDGKCVRLRQGRAGESIIFSDNPVEMALRWQNAGAEWLHLIDLDGAFDGKPVNLPLIEKICSSLAIPVQMGGGVRDLKTAAHYLKAGVKRLIIGTMALEQPDLYEEICRAFPRRVGVSLDAENGRLKSKGWVEDSGLTIKDVLPRLESCGTAFIIYTDISRDGMQNGINYEAVRDLVQSTVIPVIAAGGVHSLADIKQLYPLSKPAPNGGSLQGAISGRAIYEGTLSLPEALAWLNEQK